MHCPVEGSVIEGGQVGSLVALPGRKALEAARPVYQT